MAVEAGDILAMPYPEGGQLYRIERAAWDHTYSKVENEPGAGAAANQTYSKVEDEPGVGAAAKE